MRSVRSRCDLAHQAYRTIGGATDMCLFPDQLRRHVVAAGEYHHQAHHLHLHPASSQSPWLEHWLLHLG